MDLSGAVLNLTGDDKELSLNEHKALASVKRPVYLQAVLRDLFFGTCRRWGPILLVSGDNPLCL